MTEPIFQGTTDVFEACNEMELNWSEIYDSNKRGKYSERSWTSVPEWFEVNWR